MKEHRKDSHWIGRCIHPRCKTVVRLTVPMIGREEIRNFGSAQQWTHVNWYPEAGRYYAPYQEGLHCVEHHRQLRWKAIDGKFSERHTCDARCMNAIGPNCECSCGGVNHGSAYDPSTRTFKFSDV